MPKRETHIIIPGIPVSVNGAWRHGGRRTFLTDRARLWKDEVAWAARAAHRGKPIATFVSLVLRPFFPDHRQRDLANVEKLATDALQGIVFENDVQIEEIHMFKGHDSENPRLEITVCEL